MFILQTFLTKVYQEKKIGVSNVLAQELSKVTLFDNKSTKCCPTALPKMFQGQFDTDESGTESPHHPYITG